jgi:hypothetical protein
MFNPLTAAMSKRTSQKSTNLGFVGSSNTLMKSEIFVGALLRL